MPVKRCGAAAGSFRRTAVASGPMRCTRATFVSTRGTRSRPFSVAMIIATMAVATPISTTGMIDRPKIATITG